MTGRSCVQGAGGLEALRSVITVAVAAVVTAAVLGGIAGSAAAQLLY